MELQIKPKHFIVFCGLLLHLIITLNAPVQLLADANYDDQLYIKLAAYILSGDWLGPYDGQTLQKGVGAPLFIALFSAFGIPFRMAQSLMYSIGLSLLVLALRRLGTPRLLAWAAWGLALFSPHFWDANNMRVSRDQILGTLALWMLALALWMLVQQRARMRQFWIWGLSAGLMWSWAWNTREESPWTIVPMLLIAGASYLASTETKKLRRCKGAIAILAGFWIFHLGNKTLNYVKYGVFETIEVWQTEFGGAYGALARVLPKHAHSAVPITQENIKKVRAISPTFDQIMNFFPVNLVNYPPNENFREGEYSSGWWMSGLKSAAYSAGLSANGLEAQKTWQKVSTEVNLACDQGLLTCGPWRKTVVPKVTPQVVWQTFTTATKNISILLNFSHFYYDIVPSRGSPFLQNVFAEMLNSPRVLPESSEVVRVTVQLPEPALQSVVSGPKDYEARRTLQIIPLDTKKQNGGWAHSAEIHFQNDCDNCTWTLTTPKKSYAIALKSLLTGSSPSNELKLKVDHHFSAQSSKFSPVLTRARLLFKVLSKYAYIYQWIFNVWSLVGIYLALYYIKNSSQRTILLLFVLIPLTLIYGRLGVLALTEVTSFRTATPLYYSPLYPFLFLWPGFLISQMKSLRAKESKR